MRDDVVFANALKRRENECVALKCAQGMLRAAIHDRIRGIGAVLALL